MFGVVCFSPMQVSVFEKSACQPANSQPAQSAKKAVFESSQHMRFKRPHAKSALDKRPFQRQHEMHPRMHRKMRQKMRRKMRQKMPPTGTPKSWPTNFVGLPANFVGAARKFLWNTHKCARACKKIRPQFVAIVSHSGGQI